MNLFFIQICIITSYLNHTWTKSLNGEIDEFIHKLLKSDKFDELADKIAEKAARKIFDLDNIRISHNIKSKHELSSKKKKPLRDRDENVNVQSKEENITTTTEKFVPREIKEKPTKPDSNLNIKQVKSKDTPSSKERLRLKFKNLRVSSDKTQTEQNKTIAETTQGNNIKLIKTKLRTKSKDKRHKNRFEKVNNKHKIPKELSVERKSDGSSESVKDSAEDENEETENKSDDTFNKKSTLDKHSDEKQKSISNETPNKHEEKDNESNENKHNTSSKETNEAVSHNLSAGIATNDAASIERPKSNKGLAQKSDTHEDRSESEKEKDSDDEKPKNKRKSIISETSKPLIIRREGDKLIAFEDSSDYEEYEEKVAGQQVKRKEVPLF